MTAIPDPMAEFHADLMQEIAAMAAASHEHTRTTFVASLAERLVEAEELQDWVPCFYEGRGDRNRILAIDGYSTDDLELDGTLHVLIADLRMEATPQALHSADVSLANGRALAFVQRARAGRLHGELEPSTPAADLARLIYDSRDSLRSVRVLMVTNALLGNKFRPPPRESDDGLKTELQVWDLGRFQQIAAAGGREDVDIDVSALVAGGIPALPASVGATGYASYLCVVPGGFLADVYERYGSRILEGNVRAFLSARVSVNKGIRATILGNPEQFFAYNNGITATAEGVELSREGSIVRIRSLQVVNGGQTTASLFNTRMRDNANLDGIFVQMKLSVLPPDLALEMVPAIARYANTQSKVSEADLFANHPFNRRVEELSRRLWAPAREGSQQMTHWFFERARAQYQTEQIKLSPAERRAFLIRNPKDQLIDKTDLAKHENTWRRLPYVVSAGAQKNFVRFAVAVSEEYERNPAEFNERWFQHTVAKAILFYETERLVSAATWYTNAYRANVVTFSIARLLELVDAELPGRILDLDQIWRNQRLSDPVRLQLDRIGEAVLADLVSPPPEWSNVTEWAKKEACWKRIRGLDIDMVPGFERATKPKAEEDEERRDARADGRIEAAINLQVEVVKRSESGFWARAADWSKTRKLVTPTELDVLNTAVARGKSWVPSDRQARRLLDAAKKLEAEGLR